MKKSNILLVSVIGLAFCWTLLIGWFASYAINNYLQGKDPYFARTHRQFMESRKKTFPLPLSELSVTGEGNVILTILPGKEVCVLSDPRFCKVVYSDLKNGKAVISYKNLSDYNDPVTILLPDNSSLSLDNFREVTVRGLNRKEFRIHCTRINSFVSDSCRIGKLWLDFPRTRDQQDIRINKSNFFENFFATVRGSGKIRLETAGMQNQLSISDSIRVEAGYDIIRKLSAGAPAR
jgi:hypothetical protein